MTLFGMVYVWWGPGFIFGDLPDSLQQYERMKWSEVNDKSIGSKLRWTIAHDWKGRGEEPRPPLEEGSYLLMPVTMNHASIGMAYDILQKQDMAIKAIPEVENVVGKIGRVDSPLDPAPISMVETVITIKSDINSKKLIKI